MQALKATVGGHRHPRAHCISGCFKDVLQIAPGMSVFFCHGGAAAF